MVTLNINGRDMQVDADPSTPILWALRDNLNLTGTKYGCGAALCGACTVHANGAAVHSCARARDAEGVGSNQEKKEERTPMRDKLIRLLLSSFAASAALALSQPAAAQGDSIRVG